MDLYKLNTFRTVAGLLNFNQAAKVLNCAQSTISMQIKSLEDELGQSLFKRIKKRVFLTEAGEKMLAHANRLLAMEAEALADIKGKKTPQGTITLMVPEAFAVNCLPGVIRTFLTRYPAINFNISNCTDSGLENELQIGSVDLAFIFSDHISATSLAFEKILSKKLLMVASPDHPLAGRPPISTEDLQGQTIFFLKTGCGHGLPFRQLVNTSIIKPLAIIEATSLEFIKKCVIAGTGISILPDASVQDEIDNRQLAVLNLPANLETSVLMVWHKDRQIPDVLHNFMELIRQI